MRLLDTKPLIAGGFAVIFGLSPLYAQTNNNNLTTEEELPEKYDAEIAQYWNEYGKPGSFPGVGDINIAYMTFVRPQSTAAIVISSGRTESFIKYKELIYDLGRHGYSVFIHDHRGQGLSGRLLDDPEKGHVDDFNNYIKDMKNFYDTVVAPFDYENHVLLAHSMGGAIASLYIEEHKDDFDAAVLSSPMHQPEMGFWFLNQQVCNFVEKAWRDKPEETVSRKEDEKPEKPYSHSDVRLGIADQEFADNRDAKLGDPTQKWVWEACNAAETARKNAGEIEIPVLLLQAGDDAAVASSGQNVFCRNLNARRPDGCRLEILEGAYHEIFIEADKFREPALGMIFDFIDEHVE